jgi:hypothetical protein
VPPTAAVEAGHDDAEFGDHGLQRVLDGLATRVATVRFGQ